MYFIFFIKFLFLHQVDCTVNLELYIYDARIYYTCPINSISQLTMFKRIIKVYDVHITKKIVIVKCLMIFVEFKFRNT
jgi:hypothetical protein